MASSTYQTISADGFLGELGVDTHIAYTDGEYSSVSLILSDLQYLGIDQVRDGVSDGSGGSAPISSYVTLAKAGIHFTFIVDATTTAALNANLDLIKEVEEAVPGSVIAIEGPNEINNQLLTFNGVSGLQGALNLQALLYSDVHSDPTFAGVAVDYFTGYDTVGFGDGPDPVATGLADYDNQHPYPRNGAPPDPGVVRTTSLPNTTNPNEPAVFTEAGYTTNEVDPTVQEKYTLDLLMDAAQQDISKTYLYQLLDAYAPGSVQGDSGYGLFDDTKAAKPVATAIHNLTTLLGDSGANASSFKTTPLNYTVSGLPSSGNSIAFEESDGSYFVVVWAEPEIWNAATKTEIAAPSEDVTVSLPNTYGAVQVFDPTTGASAIASYTNKSSVTVAVTDHPILIEISHPVTAITTSGVGADGYIVGATVFADAQNTGVYAAGDAETTTNTQGRFTLTGSGPLILEGGTDSDTHLAFQGTLTAPNGSSAITPLTTLEDALLPVNPTPAQVTTAEGETLSAFGLTLGAGQTLDTLDPVGGTLADNAAAQAAFNVGAEVLDAIDILSAGLSSFTGKSATLSFNAIVSGLASEIAANPGKLLDLTNEATVKAILQAATAGLGSAATISTSFASTLASLLTASASALQQSDASLTGGAAIKAVSAVEYVAQGETAPALQGGAGASIVANDYTGSSLSEAILAADSKVACYGHGTLILTEEGEVAVERLQIGDHVVTRTGAARPIKWIGRRSYIGSAAACRPDILPICFKRGSLGEGLPKRDLQVSPEHAMLLQGMLVPAGLLANGRSIFQLETADEVHYTHVELETHDVIFAEGALSETFVDDASRGVFHNAAEFVSLYPEANRSIAAVFCAPRVEEGLELEALREALKGRAARLKDDGTTRLVEPDGRLEVANRHQVDGWAFDRQTPNRNLEVVIICDGSILAGVSAETYREDLDAAGIGDGRHAFRLKLARPLTHESRHKIEVRFADTWQEIEGSPVFVEPDVIEDQVAIGELKGFLDSASRTSIAGWAQDPLQPRRPVGLVITINGEKVSSVLANRYRADLTSLPGGDGRHAFEFPMPRGLDPNATHEIRVSRQSDGAEIEGSPLTLPALERFEEALDVVLRDVLGRTALEEDEDQALALLSRHAEAIIARRAERLHGRAALEALASHNRRWGGAPVEIERLSASRISRRALVIDDRAPSPERDAGSVALLSHMRALQELGYEVSFAPSIAGGDETVFHALRIAEGIKTCAKPHYACIEDVLLRHAGNFDLIYLHRISNAQRYMSLARSHCPKAEVVFSVADLQHLRLAGQSRIEGRPELLSLAQATERAEVEAARKANITLTHSPTEAAALGRRQGVGRVYVTPFAPALRPEAPSPSLRHGLAFLGGRDHRPNSDAVWHLADAILPRVWAKDPTITCKVVGHGWEAKAMRRLDPRVEIVGHVTDLDALFGSVRLTIAPLRFGAGIKGKVLESFAAGVPCVMSKTAADGFDLPALLQRLVGASFEEIAERILELHQNLAINRVLGDQARLWVRQEFSQAKVTESFRAALCAPAVSTLKKSA